ncbi:MAG: hypothetical protein HC821_00325 [Lewinella sp.]|nr:hypothetical protein [Lewinella sp.]
MPLSAQNILGRVYVPGQEQNLPALRMLAVARDPITLTTRATDFPFAVYNLATNDNPYSVNLVPNPGFTIPDVYASETTLQVDVTAFTTFDNLCGLDVNDITRIRQSNLGMMPIVEGWQKVAADANNNGLITITDIVILTRLILGLPGASLFSSVVVANDLDLEIMTLEGPVIDVDYSDVYQFEPLGTDRFNVDFGVIKIGDVDKGFGCNFVPDGPTDPSPPFGPRRIPHHHHQRKFQRPGIR